MKVVERVDGECCDACMAYCSGPVYRYRRVLLCEECLSALRWGSDSADEVLAANTPQSTVGEQK